MYTTMMIAIGFMFGGAVILEEIFTYPGIGYYMFQAINTRDYPLMMGAFLIITLAVVVGVLFADLTYGKIDPRAERGGEDV
jgi:peptide/nickel transport system permease protein